MQLPLLTKLIAPLIALAASANAIGNCKCQDPSGQYNDLTGRCCTYEITGSYHGDQYHQVRYDVLKAEYFVFGARS
ncbi:hypothetical protein LZ554_005806 [Drepanopeziza brunnea f. sp. 'monogermtubi']|nr:hypothetical protein LZ554_005806 [Drepanopeziza brunnea f. sp. 'monogermtubi']